MAEFSLTDEQQAVLQQNTQLAYESGTLEKYALYHALIPDSLVAFKAEAVFDGLRLSIGQANELTGRVKASTVTILGSVTSQLEVTTWHLFAEESVDLAIRRVQAELAVGLTYASRRARNLVDSWIWPES